MNTTLIISKIVVLGFFICLAYHYSTMARLPLIFRLLFLFDLLGLSLVVIFGVDDANARPITTPLGNLIIGVVFLVSGLVMLTNSYIDLSSPGYQVRKKIKIDQAFGYGLLATFAGLVVIIFSIGQIAF